jgi:predicted CXXCH cytochrome family protein
MTKRIIAIGISLIAIYLALGSVALAGNPHVDFASNPDACAACHRIHTATSGNLIKDPSGPAMCQTCHEGGIGADTDVMNGQYVTDGESDHAWGDPTKNLLGGGFDYIQNTSTTTSQHRMGAALLPPGIDPTTGPGAYVNLKCLSCHTPHQDKDHADQYRLLRVRPNGATSDLLVAWNGPWDDATQTATSTTSKDRAYTDKDFDDERPDTQRYTNNYKNGQDRWCAACHTRYTTREDTTAYDAGDIFGNVKRYRHNTDAMISGVIDPVNGLHYDLTTDLPLNRPGDLDEDGDSDEHNTMSCLTCHRVHGTDAAMSAQAAMNPVERGDLPVGSTLLRRAQRGVCTNCHANI